MVLKTDAIKSISNDILSAVDTTDVLGSSDVVYIYSDNGGLFTSVSNGEYVVKARIADCDEEFKVAVNAKVFLKLVSQTTTENIDLLVNGNTLTVKGNGTYRIPVCYDEDYDYTVVPEITCDDVSQTFKVHGDILNNILKFNARQIADPQKIRSPLQCLYYIDNKGAITYTTGATLYNFELESPFELLLTSKIVKLFKMFKGLDVEVTIGHKSDENGNVLKTVFFESTDGSVYLKTIMMENSALVKSYPVPAIRGRATDAYPYSINLNRVELLQIVNRMLIFTSGIGGQPAQQPIGKFKVTDEGIEISDMFNGEESKNKETIKYLNNHKVVKDEEFTLNLKDLSDVLSTCVEPWITMEFGDSPAVVFKRGCVTDVVSICDL